MYEFRSPLSTARFCCHLLSHQCKASAGAAFDLLRLLLSSPFLKMASGKTNASLTPATKVTLPDVQSLYCQCLDCTIFQYQS